MLRFNKVARFIPRLIKGETSYSTGAFDSEDKPICEGDILENRANVRFIVKWDAFRFGFVAYAGDKGNWDIMELESKSGPLKVVGNIFETK